MNSSRTAAVAGIFYPAEPTALQNQIKRYLDGVGLSSPANEKQIHNAITALIVPHAGYIYSGPIAASAYRYLKHRNAKHPINQVILIGPSHHAAFSGMVTCSCDQLLTPLGGVKTDPAFRQYAESLPHVQCYDAAHMPEHSLEVQLPFIQTLLPGVPVLPLLVGESSPAEVADMLKKLLDYKHFQTEGYPLIIVSTDLSHYHHYQQACRIDQESSTLITQCTPILNSRQACGCYALNGLLALAKERQQEVEMLDLRNSGDTAGNKERVVGYGAFLVH